MACPFVGYDIVCSEMRFFMKYDETILQTIPVGPLGLVPLRSSSEFGRLVDAQLKAWRNDRLTETPEVEALPGYMLNSYIVDAVTPRFGSGEAKGVINESIRGKDLYFLVDICNYSITYSLSGHVNHMSPDDHFQDLKRLIAASSGHARRINVIMPFLYESRQHKRTCRESLDCAMALQELVRMGVSNIITFDAHDPRVQNSIPRTDFETVPCTYQFVKALVRTVPDLVIDKSQIMVISPDEGGMGRAVKLANYLGVDMGMFYKRRDYTRIVNGKNPIIEHQFLGTDVAGKDVLIIDDMISSGDSMIDVAKELKSRKARRVFAFSTFGLFTNGLAKFDSAYDQGIIDNVFTTNLVYQTPELLSRPYYVNVDLSKYVALIIDSLNHNISLHELLSPTNRINRLLAEHEKRIK